MVVLAQSPVQKSPFIMEELRSSRPAQSFGAEPLKAPAKLIVKYEPQASTAPTQQLKAAALPASDFASKIAALGFTTEKPTKIFDEASNMRMPQAQNASGTIRASSFKAPTASSVSTAERLAYLQQKFPKRAQRRSESFNPPPLNLNTYYSVTVPTGKILNEAIAGIKKIPGVVYAYPSQTYKASAVVPGSAAYKNAWGIPAISAPQVWSKTMGEEIIVGVADTGIYYKHKAISSNIWSNSQEIPGNCVDDDGNGYVDDQYGWDFTESSAVSRSCTKEGDEGSATTSFQPFDCQGHGTHVAGTIGARDVDGKGVTGVAPGVTLMAAKGLADSGSGSSESLSKSILYLTDHGADVINNSWGSGAYTYPDPLLTDAIRYSAAAGVINVFAAGNDYWDMTLSHPANMDEVITVGAIDSKNKRADFSNYGARIDVVAPGVYVNSSYPDGCSNKEPDPLYGEVPVESNVYTQISGTSMAAPHVAGTVALLLASNPSLRVDEVRSILRATADDLGASGFDPYYGAGRVNVQKAMDYVVAKESVPRIDLRLSTNSLSRNAAGKLPRLEFRGTVSGVASYQITVRPWRSTNSPVQVLRGTNTVQNGLIGSADLSAQGNDKYVVELQGTTASNRKVSRAETLMIGPKAQVLATTPAFTQALEEPASFNNEYATFESGGFPLSPDTAADDYGTVRIVRRGGTNSVAETYKLNTPSALMGAPKLLMDGATRLGVAAFDKKLSGMEVDMGVFPALDGSIERPTLLEPALPAVTVLGSIDNPWAHLNRFGLLWARGVGLGTKENIVFGYKLGGDLIPKSPPRSANSTIVPLITSANGVSATDLHLQYSATNPKDAGMLVFREWEETVTSTLVTDKLVAYDLNRPNVPASRRVLFSQTSRSARVENVNYGFGLGCVNISDNGSGKGSRLVAVHLKSGEKFPVADEEFLKIGFCRVPQSNFITYTRLYLDEGAKLVGYDIATGKSGAIPLPVGARRSSITPTGDGNLSWKVFDGSRTSLIEFDITAFRSAINKGTVPKP